MKFVNNARYCEDQNLITEVRPAHRDYLSTLFAEGKLVMAGPYVDGSGATIVYEAESLEAADLLAANDPFNLKGIFVSYQLKEWKIVFASPSILERS